jgi:uncharacterized protein YigE (DUF2233 family)
MSFHKLNKIKYHLLIIFIFATIFSSLLAASSIQKKQLVPGVIHSIIIDAAVPHAIQVLEIDLSREEIQIATMKARNLLNGNEKTSEQAKRFKHPEQKVIAAINADFYGVGGIPVGVHIINGIPVKGPSQHSMFALTINKKPIIDKVTFSGNLILSGNRKIKIDGINRPRYTDEVVLYNSFFGNQTGTNLWGTELTLQFMKSFSSTHPVNATVQNKIFREGNQAIPLRDGCVISAHGPSALHLQQRVSVGDSVKLTFEFPPIQEELVMAVGGIPRIIRDGKISIETGAEGIQESFATTRHPRTAIGYSQDDKKLFLVTVDGRQPDHSLGMSLQELAQLMLELGCYQALNLDGGGSTTMVIGEQVSNRPSDTTGERAVANSILVLSRDISGGKK